MLRPAWGAKAKADDSSALARPTWGAKAKTDDSSALATTPKVALSAVKTAPKGYLRPIVPIWITTSGGAKLSTYALLAHKPLS